MSEDIEYEEYKKKLFKQLDKLIQIDKQIENSRNKIKTDEDLIEETKEVNEYFENLNVETEVVVNNKNDDK